jgi:hypothetical protein
MIYSWPNVSAIGNKASDFVSAVLNEAYGVRKIVIDSCVSPDSLQTDEAQDWSKAFQRDEFSMDEMKGE